MRTLFLSFLTCISLLFSPHLFAYDNVVIFGDSLSDAGNPMPEQNEPKDTGNNYWVKVEGKVGAPITSEDSNTQLHPLWSNEFVNLMFAGKTLYPSSQARKLGLSPLKDNVDYAYASAETGDNYLNDAKAGSAFPPYNDAACDSHGPGLINADNACVPSVIKQVKLYLNDVKNKPNTNSLFVIWAGGNDIFNNVAKLLASSPQPLDPQVLASRLKNQLMVMPIKQPRTEKVKFSYPIHNIVAARELLLAAGVPAKHIVVINLPDLSKVPAAVNFTHGNKVLLAVFHFVSESYNRLLWLAIPPRLDTGFKSQVYSVNALFNDIISHPANYQFTDVTDSCFEKTHGQFPFPYCSEKGVSYLFFNDKHPASHFAPWLAKDLVRFILKIGGRPLL